VHGASPFRVYDFNKPVDDLILRAAAIREDQIVVVDVLLEELRAVVLWVVESNNSRYVESMENGSVVLWRVDTKPRGVYHTTVRAA
jgi:hypothetical protein